MAMSESEAIQKLEFLNEALNFQRHDADECSCALQMGMDAIKEIQQYRAIGTVSEFRELKEKATAKKIGHCVFYREMGYGTPWQCLTCGADLTKVEFSCEDGSEPEEKHTFCWCCGQKLDWSEGKE